MYIYIIYYVIVPLQFAPIQIETIYSMVNGVIRTPSKKNLRKFFARNKEGAQENCLIECSNRSWLALFTCDSFHEHLLCHQQNFFIIIVFY